MPGLDGLRALAVGAVIAYHLNLGWASGGYLGVDLFFVLSGFLITGLLAAERRRDGRISLRSFWGRRARRLLPALFGVLVAVSLFALLAGASPGGASGGLNRQLLRGDGLAALAYFANWHFLAAHQSYFAQFSAPSPLQHTWSLAIEEQFYIVWPLLLVGLAVLAGRSWRKVALGATALLAWWSVAAMAIVSHGAADPSRAYFGTDARAFELLVGAGLALLLSDRPDWEPRRPGWLQAGGGGALALLIAGWATLAGPPAWMFRGGFLAASLLGGVLIASVSRPQPGPLGRVLASPPLAWVGRISYGLYLWHWPVLRLLPTSRWPTPVADLARVGVTFALAATSYYLVEVPVRRGALPGWRRLAALPAAAGATAAALLFASAPAATAVAAAPPPFVPPPPVTTTLPPTPTTTTPSSTTTSSTTTSTSTTVAAPLAAFRLPRVPTAADPLRVLVVGDSVMNDTEPALAAVLESTNVVRVTNTAAPWWGLTQSKWRTDWPALIAQDRPEVVIGTWGWDIGAAASDPAGYAALLDSAVATLVDHGVDGMVLVQYPKIGPHPGFDSATLATVERDRQAWNSVAAAEAARRPGTVAYLPVAAALELHGQYATWLPGPDGRWTRARMIDDVHPCPTGAARTSAAVEALLAPAWSLPAPAPTWWQGSWVHDPRFDEPPGSCPDDQPPPAT
ncbi:MAG TPA: acyltransferase family protein [Acidimicrobiales bacterium]|nr:acyltransferase family protein [Acidimicrobiales bacterium]